MTNGTHVTEAMCRGMRAGARRDYFVEMLADEHGVGTTTVQYHIYGRCLHTIPAEPPLEPHDGNTCRYDTVVALEDLPNPGEGEGDGEDATDTTTDA